MTHLVLVDKTPDPSGHLTGKEDHQAGEELGRGEEGRAERKSEQARRGPGRPEAGRGSPSIDDKQPRDPQARVGSRWHPRSPALTGMSRVKWCLGLGPGLTCHSSSAPRDWAPGDSSAAWGEGEAGSGRVGGDREQSRWEGHCGAPGSPPWRRRRRFPSPHRPGARPRAVWTGLCFLWMGGFPGTPDAGPAMGTHPLPYLLLILKRREREATLGLKTRN